MSVKLLFSQVGNPPFLSEVGLLPARDVPHGVRTLIATPDTNPLQRY